MCAFTDTCQLSSVCWFSVNTKLLHEDALGDATHFTRLTEGPKLTHATKLSKEEIKH